MNDRQRGIVLILFPFLFFLPFLLLSIYATPTKVEIESSKEEEQLHALTRSLLGKTVEIGGHKYTAVNSIGKEMVMESGLPSARGASVLLLAEASYKTKLYISVYALESMVKEQAKK